MILPIKSPSEGSIRARLYQHGRLPSLMWQHTLDEVQTVTVEVMERKENKHFRKDHQLLIMRFYSTTGCHREDCPSADTNSAHIGKETDQSKDEELGEREGEFQSTELLCSSMEKRS